MFERLVRFSDVSGGEFSARLMSDGQDVTRPVHSNPGNCADTSGYGGSPTSIAASILHMATVSNRRVALEIQGCTKGNRPKIIGVKVGP